MKLSVVDGLSVNKDAFISFNIRTYSERKTSLEQAEYKWNLQHNGTSHFVATDNDEVVGQIVLFPMACQYNGKKYNGVFAYDYIVAPDYLNTGIGVKLLHKTLKTHIHFGIGLSDISRKLHLALKEKSIGEIHKYVYFKNFFSYLYAAFKTFLKKDLRKMPSHLEWGNKFQSNALSAEITTTFPDHEIWNNDLIEFDRSQSFSDLRFKSISNSYRIYQITNSSGTLLGYFVLRVEIWRGMRVLIVADYRCNLDNLYVIDMMIYTSKKIMRRNNLDAILFGSSLQIIDTNLAKNGFKKVGAPSEIVTNIPLESEWEHKAHSRNLIFATPAESDFEFNLGDNLWQRK